MINNSYVKKVLSYCSINSWFKKLQCVSSGESAYCAYNSLVISKSIISFLWNLDDTCKYLPRTTKLEYRG